MFLLAMPAVILRHNQQEQNREENRYDEDVVCPALEGG
jgi:hypothetical protein